MRAILIVACSLPLCGQEVLWERTGQAHASLVADYVKFVGDVDGDGCDDLITRIYRWAPGWLEELHILSGRDGRTLRTQALPPGNQVLFDSWDGAGDMDGDGTPDYVFCAHENQDPWLDYLEVHSGRDGAQILRLVNPSGRPFFPRSDVLGGRDVTGDGRPDLILRWGISAAEAIVGAFDHTGRRLYRHVGSWSTRSYTVGSGQRGNLIGWVGDVDGDGAPDFTLGSYDAAIGRYVALVLSGRTGLVLVTGLSSNPTGNVGWCADGCGDMDLDGVPDFVACSSWFSGALVQAYSGRTGQTLRSWRGGDVMRSGGFDYDRDGVPDVLFLGGTELGVGAIQVCSGRDGEWTHRVLFCPRPRGTSRTCAYGTSESPIEVGRAQPGNPYPVFLFPEPEYGEWQCSGCGYWPLGRLRMYRGTPPGVEPYGSACAGTLGARPQLGIRDLQGRGVRLHLSNVPPGSHAALLLGFSRNQWNGLSLPASLAPLGLPDCSLFTSVELFAKTWTGTSGPSRGYASIDLPLPLMPPGLETFLLHGQWLVLDPATAGAAASDALLWRH